MCPSFLLKTLIDFIKFSISYYLDMFGLSDHDLMFSHGNEAGDAQDVEDNSACPENDYIQHRVRADKCFFNRNGTFGRFSAILMPRISNEVGGAYCFALVQLSISLFVHLSIRHAFLLHVIS